MGFEVKTVLNAEALIAYQKMAGRSVLKKRTLVLRGSLILAGVMGLTLSAVALGAAGMTLFVMLGILLSALCLTMGGMWYNYTAGKMAKKTPADFQQDFFFGEENMAAVAGGRQLSHGYGDFMAVAESEGYFVLFLDPRSGYILPKNGFVKGRPEEFGAFIGEKTGKRVTPVKL